MKGRRSQLFPPPATSEHEDDNPGVQHQAADSHNSPGDAEGGLLCERNHIEAQSERKNLAAKVEQSRDLSRLGFVALQRRGLVSTS